MADAIVEILSEFLPNSDIWRSVVIVVVIFTVAKYPWVWIGRTAQYMGRWVKCYLFGSHHYVLTTRQQNVWGQIMSGTKQCDLCGRTEYF